MKNNAREELDEEWRELILEARDLGLSVEEIRHFLEKATNE